MKVEDSTLAVVRAFERMGVRHYAALVKELGSRFYVDEEEFMRAVKSERSFNLVDEVELAKIDVFCVAPTGYQAEALSRAVALELERDDPFSSVSVASSNDVILSKLRWYRLGGEVSDGQWSDLLGVARAAWTAGSRVPASLEP